MTPEIVGIKIGKTEFKMVQYADDTTIILDGSRDSLQATLNVPLWVIIWAEGEHRKNKEHIDR